MKRTHGLRTQIRKRAFVALRTLYKLRGLSRLRGLLRLGGRHGLHGFSLNSLQLKLIVSVFVLTVPLILALLFGSQYAVSVVRGQVSESTRSMMTLYMHQIDSDLEAVDLFMNGIIGNSWELSEILRADDDDEYNMARISLYNRFNENIAFYRAINSFFMYAPDRQDFMPVQHQRSEFAERWVIQDYVMKLLDRHASTGAPYSNVWGTHLIQDEYYVLRVFKAEHVYFGAWQKVEALAVPLNLIHFGNEGGGLFATSDGHAMTNMHLVRDASIHLTPSEAGYQLTGGETPYLVVGAASRKGDFSLFAIIPDEQVLENLPYFQRLASFAPLASLLMIPLGLYFLRKIVLLPVHRLMQAMKLIREGNLNVRIADEPSSDEFRLVTHTFNSMMGQIQELTVNVYEERLNKQGEELQRLQLQINPHFFLNSLNIIYHLAKVKDYVLIKEMAHCLVQYFRFMFRSSITFVRLKDELDHISNYLRIQELRFPGQLISRLNVPQFMEDERVPPLVIQTFVENTVKHAVTLDEKIELVVEADISEKEGLPYLKIVIEDTGRGFDEAVLLKLQAEKKLANDAGEHIGIWNVQRRVRLLYGDKAVITFTNRKPRGARVLLLLPLHKLDAPREERFDV